MATTSIKEVAARAGVSVGTVSNVLNRPHLVSDVTRERVLDTIRELGFVRNESARQLRAGRSRTVGLVVLDVANPFFTDVAAGAESVVSEAGSIVVLCNSAQDEARESRLLEQLEEQRVQGILITPVNADNPRLERLATRGVPVVLVDRTARRRDRCSVAVDDRLGGRLAASHLLEQGHRRVAFVGGPRSLPQVADRLEGAAGVIDSAGDAELVVVETANLTIPGGRKAGGTVADLPKSRRPTAVFCAIDLLALGVLQELVRRGLRVPEDVAIVGYDDIEFAAAAAVPLSSVRQPREEIGRTAAQLLLEEAAGEQGHRHRQIAFDPDLVIRESSTHRRRRRALRAVATQT